MSRRFTVGALFAVCASLQPATGARAADDAELEARQRELRSRFDANGDGWLSAAERDSLRKDRASRGSRRNGRSRGRRRGFQWPAEVVKQFDTDGDGKLDSDEAREAMESTRRRWDELQDEYDADGDGRLDQIEGQALGVDIAAGKVKNVPFFIRGRYPTKLRGEVPWEKFDADENGRLNAGELAAARATLTKPPAERVEVSPSRGSGSTRWGFPGRGFPDRGIPDDDPGEKPAVDEGGSRERVSKIEFSRPGGMHEKRFALELSCTTPGAEIRYTLDCSAPSVTVGETYRRPIPISGTTVVRALAVKEGLASRRVKTATYIFLRDVLTQSADGLPPVDAPYRWGENSVDYGMDPGVVENPAYKDGMIDALESLPSVSLVLDPDDLFGKRGIYAHARMRGREAERFGSFEMLFADQRPGVRENCGVRIRGGFSRTSRNPKHGFRLFFRKEYGNGKLRYPLFGYKGAKVFDNLDLRCSQNYSWNIRGDARGLFVRDQLSRDLQLALGHPAARGEYYHLYLNGQYWGLFNSCERPEASFGETYLDGVKDDFDVIKMIRGRGVGATDGDMEAWTRLHEFAGEGLAGREAYHRIQGENPDGSPNAEYERLLEPDNLIDYMLVIFWAGNLDSPVTSFAGNRSPNNWYGIRNRNGKEGFRFFVWDAEHTLLDVETDRTGPFRCGDYLRASNPQWLWQQCLENAEFRVKAGDRIHRAFAGPLSTAAVTERFQARVRQIEQAVVAESARWGDAATSEPAALTRDREWRAEVKRVLEEYLPRRGPVVLGQLWEHGLVSEVAAPTIQRAGADAPVTILRAPRGVIHYTLDGSDPRQVGGAVCGSAQVYRQPIPAIPAAGLKARALLDGEWSALILADPS